MGANARLDLASQKSLPTVFLVAHSHWDREWYVPFEVFRARLVELLDGLLPRLEAEPEHPDFVLDGQSVVVDDYLELRPEEEPRLRRLVQAGRLRVGPFYVLPDEFLVSGEALIRNLERGIRLASRYGRCSRIGYVPDSFGHVSQLPQILQGFGLEHFLFTRGLGEGPVSTAYRWHGADGASVLALQQVRSYSHVGRLPTDPEEAADRLLEAVRELQPYSPVDAVLLCHGGDHYFPAARLPEIVQALRTRHPDVRTGGFEDYARHLAPGDLPSLHGELRGGRLFPLLPGVLSARTDLKVANHDCQVALERLAEPLDALAPPDRLRAALLDRAWRLLLLNHPHDSVCGCSADEVHREGLVRFGQVAQLVEEVRSRASAALLHPGPPREAVRALRVWNPSPFPRHEPVVVTVDLEPGELSGAPVVVDAEGRPLPVQLLKRSAVEGHHPFASAWPVERLVLAFLPPPVGGLASEVVYLQAGDPPQGEDTKPITSLWLDHEEESGFTLICGSRILGGVHRLLVQDDAGDTYNAAVAGEPRAVHVESAQVPHNGPLVWQIELSGTIDDAGFWSTRATLVAGSARVDFHTRLDLTRTGLRVRALFPGPPGATHHWSATPFDLVRRPLEPGDPGLWRFETPPDGHPVQGLCGLPGMAVFARGLAEYGVEPGPTLGLTLLRSVEWLSREGLSTRRVEAGPKIPVPDARMLGPRTFDYAFLPQAPEDPGALFREAERFALPLQVEEVPRTAQPTPPRLELPEPLVLSALRRVGEEVELRVFNPTDRDAALPRHDGRRVRLDGSDAPGDPMALLRPKEICTLRFKGFSAFLP